MQSSELSAILRSTVSRSEDGLELQITNPLNRLKLQLEVSVFPMFHLDYLSCLLTVLATILLARKSWIGLLVAIFNSLIVCAIGLRTSQLGFIPANLFCICVYAFSMQPWLKEQTDTKSRSRGARSSGSAAQNQEQPAALRKRQAVRKAVLQDVPAVD
jgi:hypothetical protein